MRWSDEDLSRAERCIRNRIALDGAVDALGWGLRAVQALRKLQEHYHPKEDEPHVVTTAPGEDVQPPPAPRIRIEWVINGCGSGYGQWFPAEERRCLLEWTKDCNSRYGDGTHRLVEEVPDVDQP